MRKKLIMTSIIVIICIPAILFLISKDREDFPHFKQYLIKSTGTAILSSDRAFKFSFVLIDEKEFSEFKSIDNIASVDITYGNKELNTESFHIQELTPTEMYKCKLLEIIVKEKNSSQLNNLDNIRISFVDGTTEEFPIGDLKFKVQDAKDHELFFNLSESPITAMTKPDMFSGWVVSLENMGRDFKIIDINTSISDIKFDLMNYYTYEGMNDLEVLNHYSDMRFNGKTTEFDTVTEKNVVNNEEFVIHIDSGIEEKKPFNSYAFKLVYNETFDHTKSLYLTPEYTVMIDGEESVIRGKMPNVRFNPYINVQDYYKRLMNEGK